MALNIKDDETDRLARELASLTGESITTGVRRAIEERLGRVRAQDPRADVEAVLEGIIARARAADRAADSRSDDDILGYGTDGLPG